MGSWFSKLKELININCTKSECCEDNKCSSSCCLFNSSDDDEIKELKLEIIRLENLINHPV
jgi:hypothetical protein